jgi:hypothetical protein
VNSIEHMTLSPTQWAKIADISEVEPVGDKDRKILLEIREVLAKHKALSRFGINLIHRHFELLPDEMLMESTDTVGRRQIVEVRSKTDVVNSEDVIETQWIFDAPGETLFCVGFCDYNKGHKHHHQSK